MDCVNCGAESAEIVEYFDDDEDSQNHYAVYHCT